MQAYMFVSKHVYDQKVVDLKVGCIICVYLCHIIIEYKIVNCFLNFE